VTESYFALPPATQGGEPMASQQPPKSHDETTLVALEQALRDVCQVLKAHDPYHDWDRDSEVQQALAKKLMALADTGVRDPKELRSRMLESFDLDQPH
jgi:hypothetical protein